MPGRTARADRRPEILVRLLLGLLAGLLSACDSVPPSSPPVSIGPAASAQAALDALSGSIRQRDRPAFEAVVSTQDPQFAATAERLFGLAELPLAQLGLRLRPRQQELTASRRALLGPGAYVQQVAVAWRLTNDLAPAEHLLWFTFVPGDRTLLAGLSDGPADPAGRPIWLVQRVAARQSGSVTVIAGSPAAAAVWQPRASAAVTAVRTRLPAGLGSGWGQRLVLEVPDSRRAFEQVLGVQAGSYAGIAAVAWPEGPDAASAAVRVLVNPELTARLDGRGLQVLLAHETVHVATRSAASPAPTWLVEGMADQIAYDAYPETAPAAAAALLARVRRVGAPDSWPGAARFSPGAPDLALSYAEAWSVCRFLAERYSAVRLARFYRLVDRGTDVDQALRSELGLGTAAATRGWQQYLESAARRT